MKNTVKILSVCAILLGIALLVGHIAYAARNDGMGMPRMALQRATRYLNLTPDQQTQARTIFRDAFRQARGVLTPAQISQLRSMRGQCRTARKGLHLTADQRAQIRTIREQTRTRAQAIKADTTLSETDKHTQLQALRQATRQQIARLLTPDQRLQMQNVRKRCGGAWRSLNLTADQQAQLKGIRDHALAQFRTILTPEQQTKFDQFVAEHPVCTR